MICLNVNYNELGRRVAKRRKELGLKQVEVNERADLSDKYLSHIETARSIPSIEVLMKICTVLDTTPDHLLLGSTKNGVDQQIAEKLNLITDEKKKHLLSSFIDWLIEQDICFKQK